MRFVYNLCKDGLMEHGAFLYLGIHWFCAEIIVAALKVIIIWFKLIAASLHYRIH